MDMHAVFIFALGILFHCGVTSGPDERAVKVAAAVSFMVVCHRVIGYLSIKRFVFAVLPTDRKSLFCSLFLFIGVLLCLENIIVYLLYSLISKTFLSVIQLVGGVLICIGTFFSVCALWTLSSTNISLCAFINQGVYTYVRHPYYLGVAIFFIGCALYMCNLFSAAIALWILYEKVVDYIISEEKFLENRDKAYEAYKKRVISGIPFYWNRVGHLDGRSMGKEQKY